MTRPAAILIALLLWMPAARGEDLAGRVRDAHSRMQALEQTYLRTSIVTEKAAVAAEMLKEASWLVQVGGLAEARDDALLALNRLAAAGLKDPLYYGFLADDDGRVRAQLTLRRPKLEQTPGALANYAERLLFVQVSAHGADWAMPDGPYLVAARALGELRPVPPLRGDKLPEDLKPFAAFFDFPKSLEAGRSWEGLLLAPESVRKTALVGIAVQSARGAAGDAAAARHLRVTRYDIADPQAYERAALRGQRLEARYRMERREAEADKPPEERQGDPADGQAGDDPPPAPKDGQKGEPPSVGVVEKAGDENRVQVRLNWNLKFQPGEVLHVRKNGEWVGKLRLPPELAIATRNVMFTDILDGMRDKMSGGTLHRTRP